MERSQTNSTVEVCPCGRPANPAGSYWFAPNDLWNDVIGSPNGFRCPECFTRDCAERGVAIGWMAAPVGVPEDIAVLLGKLQRARELLAEHELWDLIAELDKP